MVRSLASIARQIVCVATRPPRTPNCGQSSISGPCSPSLQTANSRSNPSSSLVTPSRRKPNATDQRLRKDFPMPRTLTTPPGSTKKNKSQKKDPSNQLNLGPPHSRDLILPKSADLAACPGMRLSCLPRARRDAGSFTFAGRGWGRGSRFRRGVRGMPRGRRRFRVARSRIRTRLHLGI